MKLDKEKFELVQRTENELLKTICSFVQNTNFEVYISREFPNYYSGNGIEIKRNEGKTIDDWESIFKRFFDPNVFIHKTFTFNRNEDTEPLINQALKLNYHVEISAYMTLESSKMIVPIPEKYEIRKVESTDDWRRFETFL